MESHVSTWTSAACPLPPIYEALRDLGTASVFSTLELRNGYWQMELDEESKPLTAITTPDGAAYEFQVMPFGLKGAPTTFQKLMVQEVLVGLINKFAIAYLDDIIVFSNTPEEHQRHLRLVFERLSQHGLRLNLGKCKFASNSLDYLGHVMTSTGNHPQTAHVSAIANAEVPERTQAVPGNRQLAARLHPGMFRVTCPTDRPTNHEDTIQVDPGG
ncbi:Reverse transcriptase (RNA-dependent DNA polymerase) [Popillia japonica]|uniref:Reverse transcriptase (RNA-dependent DNA polymerase) n=1 Tax=Popillia japonica TaxID=7064 RepID=A0AAW1IX63_POPJA